MSCQSCNSDRMMIVAGKCSDLGGIAVNHLLIDHDGYMPYGLNVGGGDYIELDVCLDCGQLQGEWPVDDSAVAEAVEDT